MLEHERERLSELLSEVSCSHPNDSEIQELCNLVNKMLNATGRPTLKQAKAVSSDIGVSEDEADFWWHTREASDWVKGTVGGGSLPIGKNWQADLRSFSISMRGKNGANGHSYNGTAPVQPKQETVWQLTKALEAIEEEMEEIESYRSAGAWGELPTSKRLEKDKLLKRKGEIRRKLAGLV